GEGEASRCRYTTPRASNGSACEIPNPYGLVTSYNYSDYEWPEMHPALASPLTISELALVPATFIELQNTGDEAVSLADYTLELAPAYPGQAFPGPGEGTAIELGSGELLPGQWVAVPIDGSAVSEIQATPEFEGVATLFESGQVADRIDFMHFPEGASLARLPQAPERPVFCDALTP